MERGWPPGGLDPRERGGQGGPREWWTPGVGHGGHREGHAGGTGAGGAGPGSGLCPCSIGENIQLLVDRPDGTYCFRLHRDRVYYLR